MANEEVLNLLRVTADVDTSELEQSVRRFEQLVDAGEGLDNTLTRVARNRALDNIARDAQAAAIPSDRLARALKAVGASDNDLKRVSREYERIGDAAQRATRDAQRLASQQERFDATSRNVSLAGDVQSNLGAISGLAGAAGAGGVASGVAVTGELAALVEELPRLKQAAAGLPGTISAAAGALGVGGAVAGAGLIAGLGLLAIEIERTSRVTERAAQAQELVRSQYERTNELLGETSDVISDAIEQDVDTIEGAKRNLDSATETRADLERQIQEEFNVDAEGLSDFGLRRRGDISGNSEFDDLIKRTIDAREDEKEALDSYLETSSQLEGTVEALNDAETELADQRAQTEAETASQVDQLAQAYQDEAQAREFARNASSEQLAVELERIEELKQAANEQLQALASQDQESQAVIARTSELNQQLGELERREQALEQTARPLIQQREEETAAAERQAKAIERAKERTKEFVETARARFDELVQSQVASIRQGTEDAVRFAELEREATLDTATSSLQRLRDREDALQSELTALQALADSGADVSSELSQTQTSLTNVQGDIERTFTDVLPAAVQRARQEIESDLAADLAELESERTTAIAEAEAKLAELDDKATAELEKIENDRADALEEFRQGEIRRLREYTRTIADIERKGRRDRLKAAGRLDAVALEEAIFNEQQKLQAEEERFEEESRQREQELQDIEQRFREREQERRREFDAQRRAAERELQQTRAKFDQQEAQLRANAQKELSIIQQRFQREQQLYAQANNAILQGAQALVERVRGIFGSGGSSSGGSQISIADAAQSGKQKILEALGATGASRGGSSGTTAGGDGTIRARTTIQRFAQGGVFTGASPGFAMVEPGERILSNQQTATFDRMVAALERLSSPGMGSRSATVNNTFNGFQADQVRNITRQELVSIMQG